MTPSIPPSMPPSMPPIIHPSIEQRYASANIEKSSRIQSRQTVQFTYALIISGTVALLAGDKADVKNFGDLQALLLSAGVAMFGLVFAAWIGHQDLMIGLLDSYCLALEQYAAQFVNAPAYPRIPSWHDRKSGWLAKGFTARFWSNHAFGLVLLGTALPNIIIVFENGYKDFALSLFAGLLCFTFVIRFWVMPRRHTTELKWKYRAASVFLALTMLAVGVAFFAIHRQEPSNNNFHYPYVIGSVSICLSAATLALYLWFERKRCLIFYYGAFDFKTGKFSYKQKPKHETPDHDAGTEETVRESVAHPS